MNVLWYWEVGSVITRRMITGTLQHSTHLFSNQQTCLIQDNAKSTLASKALLAAISRTMQGLLQSTSLMQRCSQTIASMENLSSPSTNLKCAPFAYMAR